MKELIKQITDHKMRRQENMGLYGKSKYGGEFSKRKYFKLKDGESIFRILPPLNLTRADGTMSDLGSRGVWSIFYEVHYGYRNSMGKMRLFQSSLVKNRKTKMIEVGDAALERIQFLKAKLEEAKAAKDMTTAARLEKLVGKQAMYNLSKNHYMNVIDTQGNIGILQIRHRAKTALDATIKRLREKGIDPLDPQNGRFFVFRRSGLGLDTTFQVDVLRERIMVEGVGEVEREVVHKLTDDIESRLVQEAAALDTLFRRVTEEEIQNIVAQSDLLTGKSMAIDAIFSAKKDPDAQEEDGEDVDDEDLAPAQPAPVAHVPKLPPVVTQAPVVAPAPQPIPQPVAVIPQQPAPIPVAPTPAVAPAKTTAQAITEQSDEEFLKSLNL